MKIFFTSDQHFFHKNIIKYASRPFEISEQGIVKCTETIFNNYCSIIKDDDIIFFLGDVFFTKPQFKKVGIETVKRLPGKKILIKGNHDNLDDKSYLECGFLKIFDYLNFGEILLCHYPDPEKYFPVKQKDFKIIIHGHIHNKPSPLKNGINVCVDYCKNNFLPLYFEKINNYIEGTKEWVEMLQQLPVLV